MPHWLYILAILWLAGGFAAAAAIALDLRRYPQHMAVMVPVWLITPLYFGPPGYLLYRWIGRAGGPSPRFWQQVILGTLHCGAGCTLGDMIAESTIFLTGASLAGSAFSAALTGDFCAAFLIGILFQYFAIVPMRKLSPGEGIIAALQADALSLISFEIGLFAWMAVVHFVLFPQGLTPASPVYWFMMQVGMVLGFGTAYPVNWGLLVWGVKEAM